MGHVCMHPIHQYTILSDVERASGSSYLELLVERLEREAVGQSMLGRILRRGSGDGNEEGHAQGN